MSVEPIRLEEVADSLTLADLLNPMQFKTVLLCASGLRNCEIAQCLGTIEMVIKKVLADAYHRTGCSNSGEVVRRYFSQVSSSILELDRLHRELAELESRIGQNIHAPIGDLLCHIN